MKAVVLVIELAVIVFMIASVWMVYVKADQPGWAAIVPIYNTLIQLRIIGRPWWWLLLLLIPVVNLVVLLIVEIDLAKSFGKGTGFGIGMAFLPFIFWPMLAFGSAQYLGPRGGASTATAEATPAW